MSDEVLLVGIPRGSSEMIGQERVLASWDKETNRITILEGVLIGEDVGMPNTHPGESFLYEGGSPLEPQTRFWHQAVTLTVKETFVIGK